MEYKTPFESQGFVSGITIVSEQGAADHRRKLRLAEAEMGNLHYKAKIHTVLRSPYQLAVHPKALDVVEQIIGPDILLYNVTYIIKEPRSESHVSWHQDLTYWGLESDDQVSMWLALSSADRESGCMRMIPGSHHAGKQAHRLHLDDASNVLFQGQEVEDIDEKMAVYCELSPGQASFHHGWTLHASTPNLSEDRRIGLNVQYIAPHVRQTKESGFGALLVRGKDAYGYYPPDIPAATDLDPRALRLRDEMEALHRSIAASE
jgi:ectoine hydroxylase-related dioxygenase (phytanoyl-CoA dioxygenase family)